MISVVIVGIDGWEARIVDRAELKVVDYKINKEWRAHETCILQKM